MNSPTDPDALNPDQLRALARQLMTQVDEKTRELHYRQTRIDQLTHELSVIKRLQFGRRDEQFTGEQLNLLDEAINEDLAALQADLNELRSDALQEKPRKQAKRLPLPPSFPVPTSITADRVELPLWLPARAYWRAHQREARLHSGRVHRCAPHPWEVGK